MEAEKHPAVQNDYLSAARKQNKELTFYLVNGLPIKGKVKQFDNFTILIEKDGHDMLIFKHAITTISQK